MRGAEGKVRKERKRRRAGRSRGSTQRWGLPPCLELPAEGWRAYRNGGRGGSAGGLMIYLDPGAPVPVRR